jgi:hypothetical protein
LSSSPILRHHVRDSPPSDVPQASLAASPPAPASKSSLLKFSGHIDDKDMDSWFAGLGGLGVPGGKNPFSKAPAPGVIMSPLDIVKKQKELKSTVALFVKAFQAPKTPFARYKINKDAAADLSVTRGVSAMVEKAGALTKELDALKALEAQCEDLECDRLHSMQAIVEAKITTMKQLSTDLKEQVDAVDEHIRDSRVDKKKHYFKARYCKTKIIDMLVASKCPKKLATLLSASIVGLNQVAVDSSDLSLLSLRAMAADEKKVEVNTKVEQPSKITLIKQGGECCKLITNIIEDSVMPIKVADEKIRTALTKSTDWSGANTKVDMLKKFDTTEGLSAQLDHMESVGASPFLCCLRAGAWRAKASQLCFAGCGSVFRAVDRNITILMIPIQPLLSQGISLGEIFSFLDSKVGGQFFQEDCTIVNLGQGDALFVPFGVFAIPIFLGAGDTSDSDDPMACVWVLPCFVSTWRDAVAKPVLEAIKSYNLETLREKPGSMWKQRLDAFELFFDPK